ncbi:Integration host factor subunit beta [Buchnera aphidicola (Eriosoma lanigerum)]|uniref:integration host factor subunit beta n=1 Tax=Buchnera aphidicola TaxID=9 RepID=UPI0034649C8B
MTKSKLFLRIANKHTNISKKIIEKIISAILEYMILSLIKRDRIEIRGFGSFSLHYRSSRIGRNPKNGRIIELKEKYVPHFKPGKELKNRINTYFHDSS